MEELVNRALADVRAWGDVTTQALIPADAPGRGSLIARSPGVLAGIEVARQVFAVVDPSLEFRAFLGDGDRVEQGAEIASIRGRLSGILRGERVALNFLQRLSGIATQTGRYVEAVRGTKAQVMDTRKTTPGLRLLEKHAVRAGGYPLVAAVPPRFAGAPDPLDLTELSGEPWIMPRSTLEGEANLLVLPNLEAANISYNLLKAAAGNNVAIGPVLLGAARPVHILTPSATVRRIVNMTAWTVVDILAGQ